MTYSVLCDENVEAATIGELEQHGITATHVNNKPGKGSTDDAIARFARDNGYLVLTNDADFLDAETFPAVRILYFPDTRVSAHELAQRVEELTCLVPDPSDLPKETFLTE